MIFRNLVSHLLAKGLIFGMAMCLPATIIQASDLARTRGDRKADDGCSVNQEAERRMTTTKSSALVNDDPTVLNVKSEDVVRNESSQTQIGFSHTQLFYSLPESHSIVALRFSNEDLEFPVTGKVHQFAPGTTAEDLAKWVNNQTSDALFPDVPEPTNSVDLPAEALKTVSSEFVEEQRGGFRNEIYRKFVVNFAVNKTELSDDLRLSAFKDSVTVYVKPGVQ